MRQQHRIESPHPLLDGDGNVIEAGYAFSPLLAYDRAAIKAPRTRIKEWDYFMVTSNAAAVAFTLSDHSYVTLDSIGFMDFAARSADTLRHNPPVGGRRRYGALGEPVNHSARNRKFCIDIATEGDVAKITAHADKFFGAPLDAELTLFYAPNDDCMVIVTPFDKPKYFYYNLKRNCIDVEGEVKAYGKTYRFERDNAYCVYDCGRGAWTRKNTWYWTTLSANKNGHRFGLNLGYGFGNTSAASENTVFWDGVAKKLGDVEINIPKRHNGKFDFMGGDWKIDGEGLDLTFVPVVVRSDNINAIVASTKQNQTFGKFYGSVITSAGEVVLDGEIGATEVFDNNG